MKCFGEYHAEDHRSREYEKPDNLDRQDVVGAPPFEKDCLEEDCADHREGGSNRVEEPAPQASVPSRDIDHQAGEEGPEEPDAEDKVCTAIDVKKKRQRKLYPFVARDQ